MDSTLLRHRAVCAATAHLLFETAGSAPDDNDESREMSHQVHVGLHQWL